MNLDPQAQPAPKRRQDRRPVYQDRASEVATNRIGKRVAFQPSYFDGHTSTERPGTSEKSSGLKLTKVARCTRAPASRPLLSL